ncbi:hypothetical protein F2Q68_00043105 [Brassica cretica]|uniref:Uncharacterized protein n=1 Tax=Brassica cretica TaxID=69181 RepID=A0A8S9LRM7_BRACR|nr:hypothetical protein F2Q68_00043105 [Brassica cretica]
MGNLNTPNSREGTTDPAPGSGVAGATREGAENHQVHNLEESDSEPESDKETPEKISATKSSMTAYLEKMFSKRFDAMQSMVERLPGVAPPIRRGVAGATREGAENHQVHNLEESDSEPESDKETPEKISATKSSMTAYLEKMFSKRFDAMQSMVERLPGVAPPIRRGNPDSYADTPFVVGIASVEIARKFSFPSIKMYDGTGDPDDHIAQYKQRMLAVALPKESREATMCKGFGSTLIGHALHGTSIYPPGPYPPLRASTTSSWSNSQVVGAWRRLQTVSTRFFSIGGLLPDGGLYKELTMYPCKTMEDVLSRAWAQVKWEEGVASRAKAQPKQDQKFQYRPLEKGEGMSVSTWPDISHLSKSTPELVKVLRHMGQQVKWPQKMKAPDSFLNPSLWCDFEQN